MVKDRKIPANKSPSISAILVPILVLISKSLNLNVFNLECKKCTSIINVIDDLTFGVGSSLGASKVIRITEDYKELKLLEVLSILNTDASYPSSSLNNFFIKNNETLDTGEIITKISKVKIKSDATLDTITEFSNENNPLNLKAMVCTQENIFCYIGATKAITETSSQNLLIKIDDILE